LGQFFILPPFTMSVHDVESARQSKSLSEAKASPLTTTASTTHSVMPCQLSDIDTRRCARIRTTPCIYLKCPLERKRNPEFALAALLGIDRSSRRWQEVVSAVAESCPDLLEHPVQCRKLVISGSREMIDLFLEKLPPWASCATWDKDLTTMALETNPKFYLRLPKATKNGNFQLAMAAMMNPACQPSILQGVEARWPTNRDKVSLFLKIAQEVKSSCAGLFTEPMVWQKISHFPSLVLELVPDFCPNILNYPSVCREILLAMNTHNIKLFMAKLPPSSHASSWDRDLAILALNKSPLFYRLLPESMKNGDDELAVAALTSLGTTDGHIELKKIVEEVNSCCARLFTKPTTLKKIYHRSTDVLEDFSKIFPDLLLIESAFFRRLIDQGSLEVIEAMLSVLPRLSPLPPTATRRVRWNGKVTLFAVRSSPFVYRRLLPNEKKNNYSLAVAALLSLAERHPPWLVVGNVDDAAYFCPDLYTDHGVMQEIFRHGTEQLVNVLVTKVSNIIAWDQDLAGRAMERTPLSYLFLPSSMRHDMDDIPHVTTALVYLKDCTIRQVLWSTTGKVIRTFPHFFDDSIAMRTVFMNTSSEVANLIWGELEGRMPWDNRTLLQAVRHDIKQIPYERFHDKSFVLQAGAINPNVFRRVPLQMYHHFEVALKALNVFARTFAEEFNREDDFPCSLFQLRQFIGDVWNDWQSRYCFLLLLECSSVAAAREEGPLGVLHGDDETRTELKRSIAEFAYGTDWQRNGLEMLSCLRDLNKLSGPMGHALVERLKRKQSTRRHDRRVCTAVSVTQLLPLCYDLTTTSHGFGFR
jgi:hypothetical protein